MKMNYSKNNNQGPSSAIGIMKFKESVAGPQLSPEAVIGLSLGIAIVILILRAII
ncbi:MAG TPA: preprotein translocase subunit Sec61beta [archaeon]|jgi:preprotein translocase subunit Sec61beta|nr:preprotein translocase subunit Sec61beta [archaeon]